VTEKPTLLMWTTRSRPATACARRGGSLRRLRGRRCEGGDELLERDNFDVLLTDFRLPNEDGLKTHYAPSRCPGRHLHFDDGLWLGGTRGGMMKRGADDYIAKAGCKLTNWRCASHARCAAKSRIGKCFTASTTRFKVWPGKHRGRIAGDAGDF